MKLFSYYGGNLLLGWSILQVPKVWSFRHPQSTFSQHVSRVNKAIKIHENMSTSSPPCGFAPHMFLKLSNLEYRVIKSLLKKRMQIYIHIFPFL